METLSTRFPALEQKLDTSEKVVDDCAVCLGFPIVKSECVFEVLEGAIVFAQPGANEAEIEEKEGREGGLGIVSEVCKGELVSVVVFGVG